MKTVLASAILALSCGCSTAPPIAVADATNVVPVQVLTRGDDGLTQRLADALRAEFARSAPFISATSSTSNPLLVTIPTHVGWEEVGGRTRVTYQVRLERMGSKLAESSGKCWEHNLSVCAHNVVSTATRAVGR